MEFGAWNFELGARNQNDANLLSTASMKMALFVSERPMTHPSGFGIESLRSGYWVGSKLGAWSLELGARSLELRV